MKYDLFNEPLSRERQSAIGRKRESPVPMLCVRVSCHTGGDKRLWRWKTSIRLPPSRAAALNFSISNAVFHYFPAAFPPSYFLKWPVGDVEIRRSPYSHLVCPNQFFWSSTVLSLFTLSLNTAPSLVRELTRIFMTNQIRCYDVLVNNKINVFSCFTRKLFMLFAVNLYTCICYEKNNDMNVCS